MRRVSAKQRHTLALTGNLVLRPIYTSLWVIEALSLPAHLLSARDSVALGVTHVSIRLSKQRGIKALSCNVWELTLLRKTAWGELGTTSPQFPQSEMPGHGIMRLTKRDECRRVERTPESREWQRVPRWRLLNMAAGQLSHHSLSLIYSIYIGGSGLELTVYVYTNINIQLFY